MIEINNEIKLGYNRTLLVEDTVKILNTKISPHGLINQQIINELREIILKDKSTHNLFFPGKATSESINSRIDEYCLFYTFSEEDSIDTYNTS